MTPELRAALIDALPDYGDGPNRERIDAIAPIIDAALMDMHAVGHACGVMDERSDAFIQHRSAVAKATLLAAADDADAMWTTTPAVADWLRARAEGTTT